MKGETTSLVPPTRRVKVTVCSSSLMETVSGLIQYIQQKLPDVVEKVEFRSLPYNISDIDKFDLRGIDVLLLCHSIYNRRFSITDVTDALYDRFLPRAKKYFGKGKVGVIVHDFSENHLSEDKIPSKMSTFRHTQPTTFQCASLVLIGGQLSHDLVELTNEQRSDLRQFCSATPQIWSERIQVMLYRLVCFITCGYLN
nr:uncharacterized protein LOC129281464 [Lytechinus pictus]